MPKATTTSYPKDKIKVLLLEGISPSAVKEFEQAGYSNIVTNGKALGEAELVDAIQDVHILGIRSKTQVSRKALQSAEKLLGLGCFCIGTNQVDLKAATQLGITVFNSPYSNTRSVAELVIANAIMLIRRIPEKNSGAHLGEWLKDSKGCYEVRGKTLGIVGYGHIGSQVSVLAESLGLKVIYYDIEPKLPLGNAMPVKSLGDLLKKADIVTLHVPGGKGTENLLSAARIKGMKKGAILINLSRGNVVDLDALQTALLAGDIAGAGIDVFPIEPEGKGEKFSSPLQGLPNVILTPHVGGSTEEAQVNIGIDVAGKLVSLLDTGSTMGSVSVPPLSLPVQQGTHRLLHIHKNVPGILSQINSIMGSMGVNILGQYLKTNEEIGYVVLDVAKNSASDEVLRELRSIQHTIKARVLY
ncbi:MAG: phosphoglycerate dehydrogenase [Chitinophagales bacterium]|nr:phosphoglycerate dehydrogenase [Chitinophagales bacterium]